VSFFFDFVNIVGLVCFEEAVGGMCLCCWIVFKRLRTVLCVQVCAGRWVYLVPDVRAWYGTVGSGEVCYYVSRRWVYDSGGGTASTNERCVER